MREHHNLFFQFGMQGDSNLSRKEWHKPVEAPLLTTSANFDKLSMSGAFTPDRLDVDNRNILGARNSGVRCVAFS